MQNFCQKCNMVQQGKFCSECGSKLVEKLQDNICSTCGHTLKDKVKFCPECGNKIAEKDSDDTTVQADVDTTKCQVCMHQHDDAKWKFCIICAEKNPFISDYDDSENDKLREQSSENIQMQEDFPSYRDYDDEDHDKLLDLANNNDIWAMIELAERYGDGDRVDEDAIQSEIWKNKVYAYAEKYANSNNPDALLCLGRSLTLDICNSDEHQRGSYFLKQAANCGHVESIFWYASLLESDTTAPENLIEAFKLYTIGAEKGDMWCQHRLACQYETGNGVEQNWTKALQWHKESEKQGNSYSSIRLGMYFYLEDDVNQAKKHLEIALHDKNINALPFYSFINFLNMMDLSSWYLVEFNMDRAFYKLKKAQSAYGQFKLSDVILFLDNTITGSGKSGFVVLRDLSVISSSRPNMPRTMLHLTDHANMYDFFGATISDNLKKCLLNMKDTYIHYFQ